jgi:HAE1 family hydrophobic/amphiphilic exporter-1
MTAPQIIAELERRCKEIAGVTLEFYEPPAVPGYGAAGGFSLRLLDKTNTGDYDKLQKS